jgi:hypothetical protein
MQHTTIGRRTLLGVGVGFADLLPWSAPARAQGAASGEVEPAAGVTRQSPLDAWQEWLTQNRLSEGVQYIAEPRDVRILMFSEAAVAEGPANRFLNRRGIAYNTAVLQTKAELAKTVATEIQSGQFLSVIERNGEDAPPMLQQAAQPLSTADRVRVLADRALDDQIRRFEPSWSGTERTDDERRRRLVELEQSYRNSISTRAELFTSGALPVCVFEGTGSDGRYKVGVGMAWSMRTQRVAQAIIDPRIRVPGAPKMPVRDQLEETIRERPDYLASAYGLQLTRDERGDPVVLAFAAVDPSSSGFRNESLTRDLAMQMIQTFVAEQAVAGAQADQRLAEQALVDGRTESFDSSSYRSEIQSSAPRMTISGLSTVRSWEGVHPSTRARVYMRVFAWSPIGQAAASAVRGMSDGQRRSVESAVGRGPGVDSTTAGAMRSQQPASGGVQAAPLRAGQSTNPSDF